MGDEWWVMSDGWWVMGDEWWVMSDGWWVMGDEWWVMNDGRWVISDESWVIGDGWWVMGDGWCVIGDGWSPCYSWCDNCSTKITSYNCTLFDGKCFGKIPRPRKSCIVIFYSIKIWNLFLNSNLILTWNDDRTFALFRVYEKYCTGCPMLLLYTHLNIFLQLFRKFLKTEFMNFYLYSFYT